MRESRERQVRPSRAGMNARLVRGTFASTVMSFATRWFTIARVVRAVPTCLELRMEVQKKGSTVMHEVRPVHVHLEKRDAV